MLKLLPGLLGAASLVTGVALAAGLAAAFIVAGLLLLLADRGL